MMMKMAATAVPPARRVGHGVFGRDRKKP